ncbi:MAG: ROK family protein [Magnetococcales bacterium]|nr:ROK family protein [Magnetococcales bacterium]
MRIGVDLGGTKIEIVVLDAQGAMVHRERVFTPQGDYDGTLRAVAGLVSGAEQRLGIDHPLPIGVGIPGSIAPRTGRIQNANSVCLIGRDLAGDLAGLLGRPVRLANDADCFTLSEAADGAGAGSEIVFGVILGTGVGGGITVGRRLLAGPNAIAGEWGHNPLPWPRGEEERPGPLCYCGQTGCIETFLSGPALGRQFFERVGERLSPDRIVERAEGGDWEAERLLVGYEDRLARALAMVINLLDPHVVVLGGGLSRMRRLYRSVPEVWKHYVFSGSPATRLLPARFGDSSGVRGAAWLWPEGESGAAG